MNNRKLVRVKLFFNDNSEREFDIERDRVSIDIRIENEYKNDESNMGQEFYGKPTKFVSHLDGVPEKQIVCKCLFCNRIVRIKYKFLNDTSTKCRCGAIIGFEALELDLTDKMDTNLLEELDKEGKIKYQILEWDEYNEPSLYAYGFFPYTNNDLNNNFSKRQVEVILKRLKGEKMDSADRKVMMTIRDAIKKSKTLQKFDL